MFLTDSLFFKSILFYKSGQHGSSNDQLHQLNKSSVLNDSLDSCSQNSDSLTFDKPSHGQWKHRKGPAPAIPVTPRKILKSPSIKEIHHELEIIETQQLGLEKQGVILERMIRERCEGNIEQLRGTAPLGTWKSASSRMPPIEQKKANKEVDDLILQLFEVINEKNELFRRQTELIHL